MTDEEATKEAIRLVDQWRATVQRAGDAMRTTPDLRISVRDMLPTDYEEPLRSKVAEVFRQRGIPF